MVESCGGRLAQLATPVHGKPSCVTRRPSASPLLDGLPERWTVGRYHSLYADPAHFPAELETLAHSEEDRVVMALAHRERPWWAVQFHPESILSADGQHGLRLIENVVKLARARGR
jgi:anthranilate synthase